MKNLKQYYIFKLCSMAFIFLVGIQIIFIISEQHQNVLAQDPITDMIQNNGFEWITKQKDNSKPLENSEIDPDSNYGKIFDTRENGLEYINEWLGIPDSEFSLDSKTSKYEDSCAITKRNFYEYTGKKRSWNKTTIYSLTIYVPFPSLRDAGDTKLIPRLAKLEPPILSVLETEEKKIAGMNAKLFKTADERCLIHLRLPRTALLFAEVNNCDEVKKEKLISMVDSLNVKRLASKLES